MTKKGILYTNGGGDYHPQTSTEQVIDSKGTNLETRLTQEEQAVRGKGTKADSNEYPFRFIGDFTSLGQLNTALDAAFLKSTSTDSNAPKYQGNLRARVNGQTVFVQQVAIDYSNGYWAQIVTGMIAPSSDGSTLIQGDQPGIYFRMRQAYQGGTQSRPWQSIQSLNLKTVNGQSLIGTGDITISGDGDNISIDSSLDTTSDNAIANSAVATAIATLQAAVAAIDTDVEGGVIVCNQWGNPSSFTTGSEGDYAFYPGAGKLYKYTSSTWAEQENHPKTGVLYVNTVDKVSCYWNGTSMQDILSASTGGDVRELRFVNVWNMNAGDEIANWSGWQWFPSLNVLRKKTGGTVTDEAPSADILYIDTEHGKLWRWNSTMERMEELAASSGSGGSGTEINIDYHINNPNSRNVPTSEAVVEYVSQHGDSSNDDTQRGFGEPNFQDPYRPEYYLEIDGQAVRESEELQAAVRWGQAFYDWPLRCFGGTIDDNITIEGGSSPATHPGEVFMPSERIIHKHGVPMDFTSDDVYFSTVHNCFVLKVVDNGTTKYYKRWGNFYEYTRKPVSGVANYLPRIDCVYSDIHLEDDPDLAGIVSPTSGTDFTPSATGQSRRRTYVWDSDESAFVDITTLMTDFTKAVHDCIVSTEGGKQKGDMHLSDRIYYVGDLGRFASNKIATYGTGKVCIMNGNAYDVRKLKPVGSSQMDSNYLTGIGSANGFTIDGGKGVLFYRAHTMFTPMSHGNTLVTAFNLSSAHDCVLRNLTMRVLRDRDNSSVSGEYGSSSNVAFSCSDSCMDAFYFSNTSSNILLENIDLQGFYHDFRGKDNLNHGITVRNLRSRDVMLNVNSGTGWAFENCDIAQRDGAGCGAHVFYPQGVWQAVFKDCRIRQGRYSSVAIGLHEIRNTDGVVDGETLSVTGYADLRFEDCVLEGGYVFEGDSDTRHDLSWVRLVRSRLVQVYDKVMYAGGADAGYGDVTRVISGKRGAWVVSESQLELLTGSVFGDFNSGGHDSTRIILQDSDINTQKPSDGSIIDLSANNAGKVTFENVRSNYINGGGAMFVEPQQRVIDSLVALDAKVLVGVRSSGTTAERPTDVYVGYCYFDTSLGGGTIPNGKPIWASNIVETTDAQTGEVTRTVTWVDATGTTVS